MVRNHAAGVPHGCSSTKDLHGCSEQGPHQVRNIGAGGVRYGCSGVVRYVQPGVVRNVRAGIVRNGCAGSVLRLYTIRKNEAERMIEPYSERTFAPPAVAARA